MKKKQHVLSLPGLIKRTQNYYRATLFHELKNSESNHKPCRLNRAVNTLCIIPCQQVPWAHTDCAKRQADGAESACSRRHYESRRQPRSTLHPQSTTRHVRRARQKGHTAQFSHVTFSRIHARLHLLCGTAVV